MQLLVSYAGCGTYPTVMYTFMSLLRRIGWNTLAHCNRNDANVFGRFGYFIMVNSCWPWSHCTYAKPIAYGGFICRNTIYDTVYRIPYTGSYVEIQVYDSFNGGSDSLLFSCLECRENFDLSDWVLFYCTQVQYLLHTWEVYTTSI